MGVSPGADVRMSEEKIESFRNFVNKIWNASRFVLMNLEGFTPEGVPNADELELCDKWILTKFQETAREITDDLEKFELGLAATKLYDFMWSNFCDWYIELAKQGLNGGDEQRKKATQEVLYYVLLGTLKLLHPYIPFVHRGSVQLPAGRGGHAHHRPLARGAPRVRFSPPRPRAWRA